MTFPRAVNAPKAPPIKSQGIKTKLVPFILANVHWNGKGRWIEPFVGSGAVLFNAAPERAFVSDTNEHLIRLYGGIQSGKITGALVREFLKREGRALQEKGDAHYYHVRDRFNIERSSLDFLFLNRSCFNGMIRFNSRGAFNVPFCRKPDRFTASYITKICNQVEWVRRQMWGRDWEFEVQDWRETLAQARDGDFIYLDPPYVGRHTDYYDRWDDAKADALAEQIKALNVPFAYSMWKQNKYRVNQHLVKHFQDYPVVTFSHFYHVGPTESLRNSMEEALVLSRPSCSQAVVSF